MLSEKVGRAAYVPICLSLVVPVLAFAANGMLTVHRDGWFIQMILEHDATLVSLSVPVLTLVVVFLSHISGKDKPEPVVTLAVVMGFLLTLVAGLMPLLDDRRPILGLPGQHYWLIAIFALQTLSPSDPVPVDSNVVACGETEEASS